MTDEQPTALAATPKKRKRWPYIVGGIVAMLVVLNIIGRVAGDPDSKTAAATSTTTSEAAVATSAAITPEATTGSEAPTTLPSSTTVATTTPSIAPTATETVADNALPYSLGVAWHPGAPVPACSVAVAYYGPAAGGTDVQINADPIETVGISVEYTDGSTTGDEQVIRAGMTGQHSHLDRPIAEVRDVTAIASGNDDARRDECLAVRQAS